MTVVRAPVRITSLRVLHSPHPCDESSLVNTSAQVFPFTVHICHGSIVGFRPVSSGHPSAIVNAANTHCLGGGGVDGAISNAGGRNLHHDRLKLPIIRYSSQGQAVRCPTGSAVLTGPGHYGSLHVPYVIHAVGPDYTEFGDDQLDQADILLQSAYSSCLQCGKEKKMECIAFSLLSAGVYRGKRSLKHVLEIGLGSIIHFGGFEELKDVFVCAFLQEEVDTLIEITRSQIQGGWIELIK